MEGFFGNHMKVLIGQQPLFQRLVRISVLNTKSVAEHEILFHRAREGHGPSPPWSRYCIFMSTLLRHKLVCIGQLEAEAQGTNTPSDVFFRNNWSK